MSIEELHIERYKVIAKYPHSPYKVGDIIKPNNGRFVLTVTSHRDEFGETVFTEHMHPIETAKDYPHLFQPLPWWAERSLNEMPEYVKEDGQVFKAHWRIDKGDSVMRMQLDDGHGEWYVTMDVMCYFNPAAPDEYTAYITQTQQP